MIKIHSGRPRTGGGYRLHGSAGKGDSPRAYLAAGGWNLEELKVFPVDGSGRRMFVAKCK